MTLTTLGDLLPLIVFILSAGLTVFARFKGWTVHEPAYLTVNGKTATFADTQEGLLNHWIWERVGSFPNGESIRITITRPYEENAMSFMSLFMDVFFFTADPSLTPETGLTTPMPPQHFPVTANASSSGSFQPDLPAGQYTCRVQANSAQNLVDAFGRYPVSSNNVEVSIP